MEVKNLILEGPDSTQVESEVQMYLLAMKNALVPEAIPVLTKYAESEVGAYSTIAITALQRYNFHLITDAVSDLCQCGAWRCTNHVSAVMTFAGE